jgi:isovaleryl-CoA dehydrogenase
MVPWKEQMTFEWDVQLRGRAVAIRDTAGRFARERIAPLAARIDVASYFPVELWPAMGEPGRHGITVQTERLGMPE